MKTPKVQVPPVEPGGDAALYLNSLTNPGLTGAYMEFYVAACGVPPHDPQLVELVRLRNGVAQSCEYCLSVRLEGGYDFDSDMALKVLHFEKSDLPPRQKAALRLAEAFLTLPSQLTREAREEALKYYSPEEIVGLLLKLTSFLVNKPRAALGIDGALDSERLTRIDSGPAIEKFSRGS